MSDSDTVTAYHFKDKREEEVFGSCLRNLSEAAD